MMILPRYSISNFDIGLVPVFELASNIAVDARYTTASRLIRAINKVKANGWPVGLERCLAEVSPFPFRPADSEEALARDFGLAYSARTLRRSISDRPASELAAYYLWNVEGPLSIVHVCKVCQLLGGASSVRRTSIFTTRYLSGQRIEFLPASQIDPELSQVIGIINQEKLELDPFILALCVMMKLLLIHPFSDGNGRSSRLFYQYVLFRHLGLSKPMVPLFPYIESKKSTYLHCCFQWEVKQNPQPLADFIIDAACTTLETILSMIRRR